MNIKQLNEMPGYQDKDREHIRDYELGETVDLKTLNYKSVVPIKKPYTIIPYNETYYCIDENGLIVSILKSPTTELVKKYFKGTTVHEESIDTLEEYRGRGITTEFYHSLLKHHLSILSDYEHYRGTKKLWKALSKKEGVIIKVFKNHDLVEEDYDLDKDYLDVWSSPSFLLLATTDKIIENLTHRLTPLK